MTVDRTDPTLNRVQNAICRIPAWDGNFKVSFPVRLRECPRHIAVFVDDIESSSLGRPTMAEFVLDEEEVALHDDALLGAIVERRLQVAIQQLKELV